MIALHFLLIALVFCFVMLWINKWVCDKRIGMIHEDWDKYQKLPSYDYMMWRFWIWDINKFLK